MDNVKKLRELIKDMRFAMLTTAEEDGTLRSRPMATQEFDFDGDPGSLPMAARPRLMK